LLQEKNDFVEEFKILLDADLKINLLDHQNNFAGTLKIMNNAAKNFLTTSLSVLYNYFDSKLIQYLIILIQNYFSNLYPAKILDLSVKLFFSCSILKRYKEFLLQKIYPPPLLN